MLAQYDCKFFIHFILSPENSEIDLLLCTSIFACKIFLMAFFENYLIFSPPIFDDLEVLHKFLYTGKIPSPVILQTWGNKSGAEADPHPVWTQWSLICTLSSATFPLNVGIILSYPFSDDSSFYVACAYIHYRQTNQNCMTVSLMRPVSCVSDNFSSYRFSL